MTLKILYKVKTFHIVIFILIFSFIPRFIFLINYTKSPFFTGNIIDSRYHEKWADDIIKGDIFSLKQGEALYKAPLYPYFLALCFKIFGKNYFIIRLIQIFLGSLSSILLYFIARKYLNKWPALLSTLLYSFYFVTIYFDNAIEIPAISNFLTLLSFYFLLNRKSIKNIIFSGLSLGLSITALPANILLLPLYILIIYFHKQKEIKLILIFLISSILVIMPVTIRNYIGSGKFVLICANKGINLYLGNNENFEETMIIRPGLEWSRFVNKNIIADGIVNSDYSTDKVFLSRIDSDNYWYGKAVNFIKTHPLKFIINIFKKIIMYFGSYEMMRNEDVYHQWSFSVLKHLPFPNLIILFPLGITGFIFYLKKIKKKWDLYSFLFILLLPNLMFFVTTRYRYFSLSIWSIFGSYSIFYLMHQIKLKNIVNILIFLLIFTCSFIPVISNFFVVKNNPAVKYIYAGNACHNSGNYNAAIENYNHALVFYNKPNNKSDIFDKAEIYYHKSYSSLSAGMENEAMDNINNTLELLPDFGDAIFIKGLILFLNKKFTDTIKTLLLIPQNTFFIDHDNFLKMLLLLDSSLIESKADIKKTEKFIYMTKFNLYKSRLIDYEGTIFLKQGKKNQAKKMFEDAVKLDENNFAAKKHLNNIKK